MRTSPIVIAAVMIIAVAAAAIAADTRTYDRPLETTWDEAVKAVRDAELILLDSDRDEHVFTMRTTTWHSRKKGRAMEVELVGGLTSTTVTVRAVNPDDEPKLVKAIARYLTALDDRMN
jgi:hypothetical protein